MNDEYDQGFEAFHAGALASSNPYVSGTDEHRWWGSGFEDARTLDGEVE